MRARHLGRSRTTGRSSDAVVAAAEPTGLADELTLILENAAMLEDLRGAGLRATPMLLSGPKWSLNP